MIRLMGILTGSAIAVGILIVGLGIPDFSATIPEAAEPIEDIETMVKTEANASPDVSEHVETKPRTSAETQVETPSEAPAEIDPPIGDVHNTVETLPSDALVTAVDAEAAPPAEPTASAEQPPIPP
ncbi:MAG: hypothetical protein ACR2QZ_09475, partial [Woeseiaceae bacterium]